MKLINNVKVWQSLKSEDMLKVLISTGSSYQKKKKRLYNIYHQYRNTSSAVTDAHST